MKKRLTSFIFVLALSFSLSLPVFAVDDIDYYTFPPVRPSEPSFPVSYPLNTTQFDTNDSQTLTNIYKIIQYLYLSPGTWQSNSIIGFLEKIYNRIPSNLSSNFGLVGGDGTNSILDDIRKWTMFSYNYLSSDNVAGNLGNIYRNTLASADGILKANSLLGSINDYVSVFSSDLYFIRDSSGGYPKTDFSGFLNWLFGSFSTAYLPVVGRSASFVETLSNLSYNLSSDSSNLLDSNWSLYHYVKNLSEFLASEDDRQLAENYKENRDEAQKDFLGGQSGPTSLGKGDFSNASQVGGALNDTFNMGGAAKVSDFLSGFGSAGTESQAWFSQTTSNNLNAVEDGDGTSGLSTFADNGQSMEDVDPDPYNMADIFSRYDWLEEVNMDD